ncbi:MAG TPA: DUF6602 domain-containing protein [Pyrinomonadaceae bacterium]|jgi:hypothetical protein
MFEISRQAIFAQAARKLRQDFDELSVVPHRGLKGNEAEKLVKVFLKEHLPKRFAVGSGFIIDRLDNVSKQTDVIIYDALNCPVYRASEDAAIFPSDNVAAVVEVKSCLDKKQLISSFENILATKQLAKTPPSETSFITSQTIGCLFAFESTISFDKILEHYTDLTKQYGIGHHIDIILVLDKGTITMWAKLRSLNAWGRYIHEGINKQLSEGLHLALATEELGTDSLDAFLRYLLTHLTFFRGIVDHPGFKWSSVPIKLRHLATITHETDPELRRQKEEQYAKEIRDDFNNMQPPK